MVSREVQLVSSQKYIVEKGCENRVGMSQLIANMLETLLHMWKLRIPPEYVSVFILYVCVNIFCFICILVSNAHRIQVT